MKKIYKLKNLDCALCAHKAERALTKISGVQSANASFMLQRLVVNVDDNNSEEILKQVQVVFEKTLPYCEILNKI